MKPSSIIVLIIAALLVISGTVVCFVGSASASAEGRELFTQVIDGKTYIKREFSSNEISTIDLTLEDATVNVTGGSITSYIEFIGYNPGSYDLDISAQTISFEKSRPDILNGFGFKGYRNYLDFNRDASGKGDKVVNIRLSEGSLISTIKIHGENLTLNVSNAGIKKDLKISSSSAEIRFTDFTAGGAVVITSPEVRITSETLGCSDLTVDAGKSARIEISASDVRNASVTTGSGSVGIENRSRDGAAEFDFATKAGNLSVDGEKIEEGVYTVKPKPEDVKYRYRIRTDSAHISYNNLSPESPEETNETEGAGG